MRAYSNMPTNEFVSQLRDIAIKANARPAVIDCIDAIVDGPTEDDIAKQISEAEDAAYSAAIQNCIRALKNANLVLTDEEQNGFDAALCIVESFRS
jgi:hypothetical protein